MKSICKACKNEFNTKLSVTQFCSRKCYSDASKITITCENPECKANLIIPKSSKKRFCNNICASKIIHKNHAETLKTTMLERYGVRHPAQLSTHAAKVRQTKKERYGNETYNNREKTKQTLLSKYGSETYTNIKKTLQTKQEKYGDAAYNNRDKQKQTMLDKYGDTISPNMRESVTIRLANKTLGFASRKYKTYLTTLGVENISHVSEISTKKSVDALSKKYQDMIHGEIGTKFKLLFSELEYHGSEKYERYPFECKTCNTTFEGCVRNGLLPRCPTCNPHIAGYSKKEKEVVEYIKSIYTGEIIENSRQILANNFELDIYLPEKKLAIEFNGNYWHSELQGKDKKYHLSKTKECENVGIRLIQIFESEWEYKQNIVKSILHTAIAPETYTKIAGRKCELKEVSAKDCNVFLNANHLQGKDTSSIRYGLYYKNTLISVMTFRKSRFDKTIIWEISRYAIQRDITILGGAEKLLTYFIKQHNPHSIVSYSDRRYFTGNIYTKLGFTLESYTQPGYHYFHDTTELLLESRVQYQKHKLQSAVAEFDDNLTEWENMQNNGYNRIWDCGHGKFIWRQS